MMRTARALLATGIVGMALVGLLPGMASAWSVSIGSSATTAEIGQAIDVTATASASLEGTGYELRIIVDSGFPTSCGYSPCTTPVVFSDPGLHTVRAELWGRDPNCGRSATYCATIRIASSGPRTLTWTAPPVAPTDPADTGGVGGGGVLESATSPDGTWTLRLSASFSEAPVGQSAILSLSLNRPLGDTGLTMRIVDAATQAVLAECGSGSRCVGTTTSQDPAFTSFRAELVRPDGSTIVATDPVLVSWVDVAVPEVSLPPTSEGRFPMAVILFVGIAAAVVVGLISWAFRSAA